MRNYSITKKGRKAIIYGLIAVAALILLSSSTYYIAPGYRGTLTILGNVSQTSYSNGIGLKPPFISTMHKTDVRTRKIQDKAVTYTKDIQTAELTYVLTYNVNPESVYTIYQYIGRDYEAKIVTPIISDALKDIIGRWDAQDLVGNRDKARQQILATLNRKLNKRFIQNVSFQIVNLDYSDNFEDAIEKKVIADQKAQEAVNNTKRIKEEANQKLISADADAKAMAIKAEALEKNKSLVDYEAVQKWDGHLPNYMLGGATPFVNLR